MEKPFFYGGQAVIEGVMMRGKESVTVAVRKTNGHIAMKSETLTSITIRFPYLKWPLLRGVVALIEALTIGIKALNFSASQVAEEEEEQLGLKELVVTMGSAILLAGGLFIVLPAFLIKLLQDSVANDLALNLVEGGFKIALFLGYIAAISLMGDIRRVFQYHGAEHKAINCLESGDPLDVPNVRRHSRFHKRCGTSFIVFVLMVSTLVFSFFGRPPFLERVLLHLALLPAVAGISYEIIRMAGKESCPWILRAISLPGIWTQKLTTREPDDSQIEVAIRSLESVIEADQNGRTMSLRDVTPV